MPTHFADTRTLKQVSRCPPLRSGAALSGLAMSTLATWSHVVQSRDVSPHNFDGLAMSGLAFSVAPNKDLPTSER